jgi:hypothetical protein
MPDTHSILTLDAHGPQPTFSREDLIDFAILGLTVAAVELEPKLRTFDFERLPSAREFLRVSRDLISELGFDDN